MSLANFENSRAWDLPYNICPAKVIHKGKTFIVEFRFTELHKKWDLLKVKFTFDYDQTMAVSLNRILNNISPYSNFMIHIDNGRGCKPFSSYLVQYFSQREDVLDEGLSGLAKIAKYVFYVYYSQNKSQWH